MAKAPSSQAVDLPEVPFSRLEASIIKTEVVKRPNSIEMNNVYRHAQSNDLDVDELDMNFALDTSHYPLSNLRSLQEVFDAVQHQEQLANPRNFSEATLIDCLSVDESTGGKYWVL